MDIGFVGLGKMGMNMVKRLVGHGHRVFCAARTEGKRPEAEAAGATWVADPAGFRAVLRAPRAVWSMVPAGAPTEETLRALAAAVERDDIVIDGGNSDWRDSRRRHAWMAGEGRRFLDVGTSGGIWGLEKGYCLMIGGDPATVAHLEPIFAALAGPGGWARVGPGSAGHFVKMVHNAVEYGMMQAYAEGFEVMERSGLGLDLGRISTLWNHGSVVRSWLLELAEDIFRDDPHLDGLAGRVEDSGEGRWALETAIAQGVPAPAFAAALFARFASRETDAFGNRFLAALRHRFGGHAFTGREDPAVAGPARPATGQNRP
ncbi:MAG: decarboxylating 6-phosphogluconate dehydrogenase [Candidatus Riflebacteria bacterium]|nr:decarboxylating 6-phosphogluconate dehydrogenase [Candidatus Riflebacteria bacterium]